MFRSIWSRWSVWVKQQLLCTWEIRPFLAALRRFYFRWYIGIDSVPIVDLVQCWSMWCHKELFLCVFRSGKNFFQKILDAYYFLFLSLYKQNNRSNLLTTLKNLATMKKYLKNIRKQVALSGDMVRAIKLAIRTAINADAPLCMRHINLRAKGWTTQRLYN